jgi:hypothetical protein
LTERIASAANTVIPAVRALETLGYAVARRDSGREPPHDEWWTAAGPLGEFVAEDPVTLLGLVAMRDARGPDWKPTDAEIDDFMARFQGR